MASYFPGMRHGYRILAGVLTITFSLGLSSCQQDTVDDKSLIQQRLQQMAKAVENRQVSLFLEGLHADFLGQGKLRKANLAGLLHLYFRQHQTISVSLTDIEIQLEDTQATVTLVAQLHGQGGWLGQGRRLQIQSRWQKVDGEWKIERARWRQIN